MPSGTNVTGSAYGIRQGSAEVVHTYPVAFNTTGISSGIRVGVIKASGNKPVHVEVSAVVLTVFDAGTTNVLTVGTTSAATEILAAGDITEGATGFYPASNAVSKRRLIVDTDIYVKYTQTGTAATLGEAVIIVKEFSENTTAVV